MAARRTTGARTPSAGAEASRAFTVVLERIESQMATVIEAVTSSWQRLDAKIDGLEARLSERISVLEQVVRQNSLDIQKNSEDIRRNSEDIIALRNEVARLRHDFEHREERGRMDALELRVAALEARLGVP